MAKKRSSKRRGRSLGNLKSGATADILPSGLGLVAGGGTTLALYALVPPTGTVSEKVHKFAPLIGTVVGGFGALGMSAMGARPAQAVGTFIHAAVASLLVWGAKKAFVPSAPTAPTADGVSGLGATVLEKLNGTRRNLGNVVVPQLGANNQDQGQTVSLAGTVQTSAFGQKAYD